MRSTEAIISWNSDFVSEANLKCSHSSFPWHLIPGFTLQSAALSMGSSCCQNKGLQGWAAHRLKNNSPPEEVIFRVNQCWFLAWPHRQLQWHHRGGCASKEEHMGDWNGETALAISYVSSGSKAKISWNCCWHVNRNARERSVGRDEAFRHYHAAYNLTKDTHWS